MRSIAASSIFFAFVLSAGTALVGRAPLAGQEGTLTGTVFDEETGAPLSGVAVATVQPGAALAPLASTGPAGAFRFQLAPGTHTLVFTLIGYEIQRVEGVRVTAGDTTRLQVRLRSTTLVLNPLVVTASRRTEKALDAPAAVQTVGRDEIVEQASPTPIYQLQGLAGVDVALTGLQQATVVTRGFNNIFSGALLVLVDNRIARVPSLRFNAYNMIPSNEMDLERMEVVLGPGSALYGPNSANGVLHLITTSPIDEPGSSVSLTGGERSVFRGAFRHAERFNERWGVKLSGQYFQGDDWRFVDPFEQLLRENAIARGADPEELLIGARDFEQERWGFEGRVDWRPSQDSEAILTGGLSHLGSSVELTGTGAAQADDWRYSFLQGRFTKGRLFGQLFINTSDAGDTYLLRTGDRITDESRAIVAQLQHGWAPTPRLDLIYGVDYLFTEPRTSGTITGSNEDDDEITEVGGYLHGTFSLTEQIDLVGALRVDHHDRLVDGEDVNYSPRAAVVWEPAQNQSFRLTFNRAFSTPTTNNLFLDLRVGEVPIPPDDPLFDYDVRTRGVPSGGYTFTPACPGGIDDLCMRSPFPGAPGTPIPADAVPFWNDLVGALVPAQFQAALFSPGSQPGDPDLGSRFLWFDQEAAQTGMGEAFKPDLGEVSDISPMRSTIQNTIEVGYRGVVGNRLLLSADLYRSDLDDFIGPLRIESPNVFLDPARTAAFVMHRLGPLIDAQVVTPEQAQAIIQGLASVPVGVVVPDEQSDPDLLITYRNFGDVDLWGADLTARFLATAQLTIGGSYSFVSDDCFDFNGDGDCTGVEDVALNAPKNKGSLSAEWDDEVRGLSVGGTVRAVEGFPMNSGVYVGEVDGYAVVDANVEYRLPWASGASVALTAYNLFDNRHREAVGAPRIGRLFLARLKYSF